MCSRVHSWPAPIPGFLEHFKVTIPIICICRFCLFPVPVIRSQFRELLCVFLLEFQDAALQYTAAVALWPAGILTLNIGGNTFFTPLSSGGCDWTLTSHTTACTQQYTYAFRAPCCRCEGTHPACCVILQAPDTSTANAQNEMTHQPCVHIVGFIYQYIIILHTLPFFLFPFRTIRRDVIL